MTFDEWASQEGLISESHGVRFVNSQCDVARKAWQAALESRALAERKPIYQVRLVGQLKWSDIEPVSLSMYQDAERYQTRIVFTHPTPDDASDAARYRWLRNEHFPTADNPPLAQVVWKAFDNRHSSDWANLIDGNDLDAAIDAAMKEQKQSGEEKQP